MILIAESGCTVVESQGHLGNAGLDPYNPGGSTRFVAFNTSKNVYRTDSTRCHVNYVVQDSDWDSVERYAAALEIYTSAEPLPRTTFLITKGRALAKFGKGTKGPCVSLMGLLQAP